MTHYIIPLEKLGIHDVEIVGGKNASLGEMIRNLADLGVSVPGGFATTAHAYREFLSQSGLDDKIGSTLDQLDVDDVNTLAQTGQQIRQWIMETPFPPALDQAVEAAFAELVENYGAVQGSTNVAEGRMPGATTEVSWAVRSSATAEDLPDASFAGQQETFLNVRGMEGVKKAIHEVFASLYNDRAIAYRVHQGFDHRKVALSAGVQKMVRSDLAASGVAFTLDTESGFQDAVFITGSYGLGEMVVQGAVNPDEFFVYKPALAAGRPAVLRRTLGAKAIKMTYGEGGKAVQTLPCDEADRLRFCIDDAQLEELARHAVTIEKHYGRPMDIEWALDGLDGRLYIVQARPETVQSRKGSVIERYELQGRGEVLAEGRAIGQRIGSGTARVIHSIRDMDKVKPGDVLVTDMTDPDWEPIMKRASGIVTNRGGRTCHAAIIARELGVAAVVGCGDATETIPDGEVVTVSCAEGETGYIYRGALPFKHRQVELDRMPAPPVKMMMNVGNPERAFDFAAIPNQGIGLARLEFLISNSIGIHPKALLEYSDQTDEVKKQIAPRIAAYGDPVAFYVAKLTEGVATLAAAFAPNPVIVRLSDFKSNEYANLIGGNRYEPHEENPMIGFRGASRYASEEFKESFRLECEAVKRVRNEMGLTNVEIMIPFVRTLDEAAAVLKRLDENGLRRGENGLRVIMMCEVPSNAILADEFLNHFDGFSIGSNDLTQLTLGLDRDSALVAAAFDERNPAVKKMLKMAIEACRARGKYVGICGQGPSDHPDLAEWLVEQGISSVSLNPDTMVDTWLRLAKA